MFARTKRLAAATALSGTLLMGFAPAAGAQQTGLVNVEIVGNNVVVAPQIGVEAQIPIGVAANVCDVNVALLAAVYDAGGTTCDSTVNQRTESAFEQIQRILARTG